MPKSNSKPSPQLPAASITSDAVSTDLEIIAPGTLTVANKEDSVLAYQLNCQYSRAAGAMREILIFGGMMIQLSERCSSVVQARTTGSKFAAKDESVKGWLAKNTPDINASTAFRFKAVAEAVKADFALPAKMDFLTLVTTPAGKLEGKLQLKQAELFDFVNGTSQKSWLDRFKQPTPAGGDVTPRDENGKRIQHIDTKAEKARLFWEPLILGLEKGFNDASWGLLPRNYIVQLKQALIDLNQAIPKEFTH